MTEPPTIPTSPPPLLSPEQLQEIAAAQAASRRIHLATVIATCDGWTLAIFAGLSLVCGLSSLSGVLLGVGLAIVAVIELSSSRRLRRLDHGAARVLGLNQLALACMLILYAVWSIHAELSGPGILSQLGVADPGSANLLQDAEGLARQITLIIYGALIVIAIGAQGGMSLYYFSRARHIQAYLQNTPPWILQMQRAGVSL